MTWVVLIICMTIYRAIWEGNIPAQKKTTLFDFEAGRGGGGGWIVLDVFFKKWMFVHLSLNKDKTKVDYAAFKNKRCPNNTPLNIFVGEEPAPFTFMQGSFYIDVDAMESSLLSQRVILIFEDLWILSVLGLEWNDIFQTSHRWTDGWQPLEIIWWPTSTSKNISLDENITKTSVLMVSKKHIVGNGALLKMTTHQTMKIQGVFF